MKWIAVFVTAGSLALASAHALADHVQGHDEIARGWVQELDSRLDVLEATPDADTLGSLSCTSGEVAKFNGASWICAADEDTSAASCQSGQVLVSDGTGVRCVDLPTGGGQTFQRTLVVGGGSNAVENCDQLQATLDSIVDNGPGSPYLIKLEPGIYDCGATSVLMKPYVDIEGSGINVTNITGNGNNLEGPVLAGVVAGADQTGLRNLTVTHLGGAGLSFAIAVTLQGGEMRMTDLVAKVEDAGQSFSSGIVIADTKGIIVVEDVRAITPMFQSMAIAVSPIASNESVEIVLFNNVLAQSPSAAMGLFQTGAIVRNSILDGGAIGSERFFGTAKVISTGIFGTADGDSLLCIGAYDFDLQPLDATCQGSSVATLSTEPPVTNPFTTAQ